MDRLWAPWRHGYAAAPKTADTGGCFLCRGLAETNDRENLIVRRTEHSCVVLNKFPYNNGHLLVAPLRHLARLDELPDPVADDLQRTIRTMVSTLEKLLKPEGFNIGLNLGKVAGAGLPGHLHWHIVPRWSGDANFMPACADTKVIVQSLDSLYDQLEKELKHV